MTSRVPVLEEGNASCVKWEFPQQLQPLGALLRCDKRYSGDSAAWSRQTRDVAADQHVADS